MNVQRARPTCIAQGARAGERPRLSGSTALSRNPRRTHGEVTQNTSSSVGLWKQGSSAILPDTQRQALDRELTSELLHVPSPWNQRLTFGSPLAVHGL